MKKIFFIIGVTLFIVNVGFAQIFDDKRDIKAGLKIGANLSNVYDSKTEEFKSYSRVGFAAGAFLKIPIGSVLGFQPEFLFSQKGYLGVGKVLGLEYEYSRRTNFIDVPLLLSINPFENLTILLGPQYSYLLQQTDNFTSDFVDAEVTRDFNNEDINKNILCFIGGVDISIDHLVIGARLGWDLTKNNGDGSSTVPRYKNAWYQATVGFSL